MFDLVRSLIHSYISFLKSRIFFLVVWLFGDTEKQSISIPLSWSSCNPIPISSRLIPLFIPPTIAFSSAFLVYFVRIVDYGPPATIYLDCFYFYWYNVLHFSISTKTKIKLYKKWKESSDWSEMTLNSKLIVIRYVAHSNFILLLFLFFFVFGWTRFREATTNL